VADEMSPGEIGRTLERIERQQQEGQRALGDRMTKLAADMVPTTLWSAEHKAVVDNVHDLEGDMHDAIARIESTSQERMTTLRGEIAGVRGEVAAVRKGLGEHNKKHESDSSWSRSKTLTVVGIVATVAATLIGAWIAAFAAAGGVR